MSNRLHAKPVLCFVVTLSALSARWGHAQPLVGEPQPLAGSVNAVGDNADPSFTADGLGIYFASTRAGGDGPGGIWYAERPDASSPWGESTPLDELINSGRAERTPWISSSGLELFFSRGNTVFVSDSSYDMWVARRPSLSAAWGEPQPMDELNSDDADFGTILSDDGLSLYFSSTRPNDEFSPVSSYVAHRPSTSEPFGTPERLFLGSVSDITPDGLTALIDSDAFGGLDDAQIWMRTRDSTGDPFGPPVMLDEPINEPSSEDYGAVLGPEERTIYFSSNRNGGRYRIWEAPIVPEPSGLALLLAAIAVLAGRVRHSHRIPA